ncbi:MAG: fibronectin type III domain-containing protein [Elusimicrobiota bacterium]
MVKKIVLKVALVLSTLLLLPVHSSADFVFLVYTDTHIQYPTASTNTRATDTMTMINNMSPLPKFVANAGDMVEAGLRREYDTYRNIVKNFNSSIALYEGSPGNHDMTRGMGGLYYRERIGAVHSSFMYDINGNHSSAAGFDPTNGYHFLILNEGMLNHGDGHFPRFELDWIKSTLDASPVASIGRPVICFFHHPTSERADTLGEGDMIDNDRALIELLKNYNLTLMLYGHVHSKQNYTSTSDAVPAYSFYGTMDNPSTGIYGGVGYMTVSPSKIEVRDYPLNGSLSTPRGNLAMPMPRYPKIVFSSPVNDSNLSGTSCTINAKIELYQGHIASITSAYYQIDDGGCLADTGHYDNKYFKAMGLVNISSSVATASVTTDMATELTAFDAACSRTAADPWYSINGVHRIKVRFDTSDGKKWYRSVWVNVTVRKSQTDNYAMTSVWRKDIGADVQGDIAVDNNKVFVNPYGRYMYCYDTNGNQVWKFDKEKYGEALEEASGTVVDGNSVIFGSYNGSLYALDTASGTLKWRYKVPDDAANEVSLGYPDSPSSIYSAPLIDNGVAYFGTASGYLYAVNTADGSFKWKYQGRTTSHGGGGVQGHKEIVSTPVIFNNAIYFTGWSGYIHALSLAGVKKFETLIAASFYYSPANTDLVASNGYIFAAGATRWSDSYESGVFCVDAGAGTVKWSTKQTQSVWASLGVNTAKTHVYSKTTNGRLNCFGTTSASPLWYVRLGCKAEGDDILRNKISEKDGIVYIPHRYGGTVFAVKDNGSSGTLLWKYKAGVGYVTSMPVSYGERVYVGTMDGHLVSIGKVATVVPGAPTGVTAVPTGVSGQVRLTWSAPTTGDAASGYRIYRSNSNSGPWNDTTKIVTEIVSNTYTDTGLTNGAAYYYVIKAFNNVGDSTESSTVSATPAASMNKPNAAFNLQAKNNGNNGAIDLTWSASPVDQTHNAAVSYAIWRSTVYASGYEQVNTSTVTYNAQGGLLNGTTYYFKIRAVNTAGEADSYSNVAFTYPTDDTTPPPVPSNVTVTDLAEGGKLNVSWSAVTASDLAGYKVYRSEVSGNYNSGKIVATIGKSSTTFTDTGLENGKKYYYVVASYDNTNGNISLYSSEKSGIPTGGTGEKPLAPENVSVSDPKTGGSLQISWGTVTNASYYRLYRAVEQTGTYSLVISTNITNTVFIDSSLMRGTTYYYKVRAMDAYGNISDDSVIVSGFPTGSDMTPPDKVDGMEVDDTGTGGEIKISWNTGGESNIPDLAGYRIYCSSMSSTGAFDLLTVSPPAGQQISSQEYAHESLVNGVRYYYRMTAFDNSGNESAYNTVKSTVPSCTVDTVSPVAPVTSPVTVLSEGKQLVLSWNESTAADLKEYRIYRSETGVNGAYTEINVVAKGITSITDTGLKNNVAYWYRIAAVDINGNISQSVTAITGTPVDTQPPEVQAIKTTPADITQLGQMKINFVVTEPLKSDPLVKINGRSATRTSKVEVNDAVYYTYAFVLKETDLVSGQVLKLDISAEDEAGLKKDTSKYVNIKISKSENVMRVLGNKLDFSSSGTGGKAVIQYYFLEDASYVRLKIYNMAGELVKLINGDQKVGWGAIEWDGTNAEDKKVTSGIYFAYLESDVYKQTSRIVVLK